MDLQLISNIVLSALSFGLALVSVLIAIFTLRQNNKMIEASTRPYVGFKVERIDTGTVRYLFVLRNYGTSIALMKKIDIGVDLEPLKQLPTPGGPFEDIADTTLMPGQQLSCVINYDGLKSQVADFVVHLEYDSLSGKHYKETLPINVAMNANMVVSRTSTKDGELKSISYSIQEFLERSL